MLNNDCRFYGRLGKDVVTLEYNKKPTSNTFSLAVDESYKNEHGERIERTLWVSVYYPIHERDEIFKFLKTGTRVLVRGKVATSIYEAQDKATGRMEKRVELICRCKLSDINILLFPNEVQMLKAAKNSGETYTGAAPHTPAVIEQGIGDDLPF